MSSDRCLFLPLTVQKVVGILASCSDGVAALSVSSRVVIGTVILRNSLINKLGTFNGFSKRKILYFATCFCFVLALLLLALSFSFLISLLIIFSSGVPNALKALDRVFLTFCLLGITTSYGG